MLYTGCRKKSAIKAIIITTLILCIISSTLCISLFSGTKCSESILTMNNSFSVTIPKFFTFQKANYATSSEISEHFILDGTEKLKGISGYVQTWNMKKTITEYIEQLENSLSSSVYDYEKSPLLPMNGSKGYNLSFYINNGTYSTHVLQSIWQQGDKMYVLSLSAPSNLSVYNILLSVFEDIKNSVVFT